MNWLLFKNRLTFFLKKLFFWFKILVLIIFLGGLVFVGYYVLASNNFTIDVIKINAPKNLDTSKIKTLVYEQMDQKKYEFLSQSNIFVFDEQKMVEKIQSKFFIDQIDIKKDYPHQLTLTITQKPLTVVWQSNNKVYNIDQEGRIIKEIHTLLQPTLDSSSSVDTTKKEVITKKTEEKKDISTEKKAEDKPESKEGKVWTIIDELNIAVNPGDQVLNTDMINFLLALQKNFESKTKLVVKSLKVNGLTSPDIKILTNKKWEVYMNTSDSLDNQINRMNLLMQQKLKDQEDKLQYIDLRFGNKVFYKL